MNTKHLFLISMIVLLAALFLAACGTAAPAVPTVEPTTAPPIPTATPEPQNSAAIAENFPTGKFVKSNSENYGLIFNEDKTFSVFDGSLTIVKGTYSVDGDIYTEESNNKNCPPMSFKYAFDGTNLTFNYVGNPADDPCDGRRFDLNNVTYILSK